jgi:hypothetical protein
VLARLAPEVPPTPLGPLYVRARWVTRHLPTPVGRCHPPCACLWHAICPGTYAVPYRVARLDQSRDKQARENARVATRARYRAGAAKLRAHAIGRSSAARPRAKTIERASPGRIRDRMSFARGRYFNDSFLPTPSPPPPYSPSPSPPPCRARDPYMPLREALARSA